MGRQTRRAGSNKGHRKKNTPPTGVGKDAPRGGTDQLRGHSEQPLQAQRDHPELNLGDSEEESAVRTPSPGRRRKAGR